MILLTAVVAGATLGYLNAKRTGTPWQLPNVRWGWLIPVGFLPQFLAFYLPATREFMPDWAVSVCLISSQAILTLFCLLNWRVPGILVLGIGILANLVVILANGGFMPLSLDAAARVLRPDEIEQYTLGKRLGTSSKDILLLPDHIKLPWLADRFASPLFFPTRFVFSLGDVLIAAGVFWFLVTPPGTKTL